MANQEVIDAVVELFHSIALKERDRAVTIVRNEQFKCGRDMSARKAALSPEQLKNDVRYIILKEMEDEMRCTANAISGGNALSVSAGETMLDRIKNDNKGFVEKLINLLTQ